MLGADLMRVAQVDINMLAEYDLIGFGSGVYFGKYHKSLLELVDKLPRLENKRAFIFSTSGLRKIPFIHDFAKPLKAKLKQKGLNIVGEFSCRGFDTSQAAKIIGGINRGRPDEKDLRLAENFARGLQDRK
ncbi:unnamed protein product [marine sediment metagenome]|uniref:Flavodoxin domain-containing protein n=1 Tax=marine sediment metagenome TaxID=412755 RepID=X1LKS3_9ZZZZ